MRQVKHHAIPAFKMAVLLCGGVLAGKQLPGSGTLFVSLAVSFFLLIVLLVFVFNWHHAVSPGLLTLLTALACFVGGAAKFSADRELTVSIPDSLSHQSTIIGRVQEPPSVANGHIKFALASEALFHAGLRINFRANMLVTVIPSTRDSTQPRLRYGMLARLWGTVEAPTAERNPGEFSPREYYEANGISLLMTVKGADQVAVIDSNGGAWLMRQLIFPVRQGMLSLIDSTVGEEEGEFLKGLMIGDRSGISQATRQAFVNSGVAHVLAVSGSNVAVVASIFVLLFELMRLPGKTRIIAVLAALLGYMVITGNQPSIVRATIMAFVYFLAKLFQNKMNAYNAMGISALVILGFDSRQMFDIGFQLSYGAVLSIIYLYPKANAWISMLPSKNLWLRGVIWLLRICAVSLVATLGTLPLTAVSFGRVSVIGILANIIVIPAVELSVVLGFAASCAGLASLWLARIYAAGNAVILTWTLRIIKVAGASSFAYIDTTTFVPIDALPFYGALFVMFNHTGKALKYGTIAVLVTLNIAVYGPRGMSRGLARGVMRVSVIDVGQGDAILAELPGEKTILMDAGPRSWQFDSGENIVTPFLKRRGISTIDLLVISHGHNDHAGGMMNVLQNFRVKRIVALGGLPAPLQAMKKAENGSGRWCDTTHAGMSFLDSAGARLYVLYPFDVKATSDADTASDNRCIVVKLQYGAVSCLFTGDAEAMAEADMVSAYGPVLHCDLLKAGHHGSSTSTSQVFLETVHPSAVVISVGRNNKFHHPSPAVVERIRAFCGLPARTDEDGAVMYETDGRSLWRVAWR